MKKKVLLIVLLIIFICGCSNKSSDALLFKNEYEKYNNTSNENGIKYRNLDIGSDNPIIISSADEIVAKMDKNDTFLVYFGFATCPWCRSIIESLLNSAKNNNLNKIYYVDVLNIRDKLEISDDGKVKTTVLGTDGYYKLLDYLNDVLSDYTLTDNKGNTINTMEKRILAPNIVAIKEGKAIKMVTGVPNNLTNPYDDLTDEMKESIISDFNDVIALLDEHICNPEGC